MSMLIGKRQSQLLDRLCGGWRWLHGIAAIALVLRLVVAFTSEQIWHPDEVFQYLEQGHRLAFGYGTIPWEYRYGLRSWILPGIIAGILTLCQQVGLDDPHGYIPVIQGLTCLVSVGLVYCAYWIGRQLASETVGRVAAVLTALWHELITVAHKPTPEIVGAYLLMLALALLVVKGNRATALLVGMAAAAAVALRLQYAPVAVTLAVAACFFWRWHRVAIAMLGGLLVVALAGAVDAYTWGFPFASYYHNYLYNKVYGVSLIWGRQPVWTYPLLLAFNSGGVFLLAIGYSCLRRGRRPWLLLALVASVVVPHTLIGHKEYRFIFVAIPLCLLLTAIWLADWLRQPSRRRWVNGLVGYLVVCSLAGVLVNTRLFSRSDPLEAALYLNDAPDLSAVLNLHSHWFNAGGYYYLHRDVPIYFPEQLPDEEALPLADYFSHIIVPADSPSIDGFAPVARFDSAVVLKNQGGEPEASLGGTPHIPLQGGVDGVYEPRITPRF